MEKSELPTSFSWKRGFFASQLEGLYDHKALTKEKATRNLKIQWPIIENKHNQAQWKIATSTAVLPSTPPAMATNPASLVSLNAMIANVHSTHIGKKHKQHDPKPSSIVSPGTVPHTTQKTMRATSIGPCQSTGYRWNEAIAMTAAMMVASRYGIKKEMKSSSRYWYTKKQVTHHRPCKRQMQAYRITKERPTWPNSSGSSRNVPGQYHSHHQTPAKALRKS